MSEEFDYDVFLSYSPKDKAEALELAQRLRSAGLRVWFDDWEVRSNDIAGKRIDEGLKRSRALVFCMSKHAFSSEWTVLENATFRFRDPNNQQRRFIPVRFDDANVPLPLKQFAFIDWRNKSPDEWARLLDACRVSIDDAQWEAEKLKKSIRSKVLTVDNQYTIDAVSVSESSDGTFKSATAPPSSVSGVRAVRAVRAPFLAVRAGVRACPGSVRAFECRLRAISPAILLKKRGFFLAGAVHRLSGGAGNPCPECPGGARAFDRWVQVVNTRALARYIAAIY